MQVAHPTLETVDVVELDVDKVVAPGTLPAEKDDDVEDE
jgi:hypothetical protein